MDPKINIAELMGESSDELQDQDTTVDTGTTDESESKANQDPGETRTPNEGVSLEEDQDTTSDEVADKSDEEPKPQKTRAQRRIEKLSARNRALKESQQEGSLPWDESKGEMTHDDLNQMIESKAQEKILESQMKEAEDEMLEDWQDNADQTLESNPSLNPESELYDPELDDLVTALMSTPDGSLRTDLKLSDALALVSKMTQKQQANLVQSQATNAEVAKKKVKSQSEDYALNPGGSGAPSNSEEVEAEHDPVSTIKNAMGEW